MREARVVIAYAMKLQIPGDEIDAESYLWDVVRDEAHFNGDIAGYEVEWVDE